MNEPSYEEAARRLETIVQRLERGDLELDSLSENIREAQALLALCREKLTKIETDVNQLLEHDKE